MLARLRPVAYVQGMPDGSAPVPPKNKGGRPATGTSPRALRRRGFTGDALKQALRARNPIIAVRAEAAAERERDLVSFDAWCAKWKGLSRRCAERALGLADGALAK